CGRVRRMLDPDDGPGVGVGYLRSEIALALDADPENRLALGRAQNPNLSDGRQVGRYWFYVGEQDGVAQQWRGGGEPEGLASRRVDQGVGVGQADLAVVAFLD